MTISTNEVCIGVAVSVNKYLFRFYYSISHKVITLSAGGLLQYRAFLLHYRAIITLSGVFLLHYRAIITSEWLFTALRHAKSYLRTATLQWTSELSDVPARWQEENRRCGHASSVDRIHWRVGASMRHLRSVYLSRLTAAVCCII